MSFEIQSIAEATDHFILAQKRSTDHGNIEIGDIVQTNKLSKIIRPKSGKAAFPSTIATVVVKKFTNRFGLPDYYYYYILYRDRLYRGWAREEAYSITRYDAQEGVIFPVDVIKDIQDNRLEGNSAIVLITKDTLINYIASTDMFAFMRKYSWFYDRWGERSTGFGKSMTTKIDPFLAFMGINK